MTEKTDLWASDFAETPAFASLPDGCKKDAIPVCMAFLDAATTHPDIAPEEISENAVRHAMLDHMPALELPEEVRKNIPVIVAALLESLEDAGRLSGGRALAGQAMVLAKAFHDRCKPGGGVRTPPIVRAAPKIGRNDPCPCGSGKKHKKCCLKA